MPKHTLAGQKLDKSFLFRAGKIAEAVILAISCGASARIEQLAVLSCSNESNHELVERLQPQEITENTVTLPLGIDELPTNYFDYLLKMNGVLMVDDMDVMEAHNIDSLALYYSKRDLKLTKHDKASGVKNYSEALFNKAFMEKLASWNGPTNFSIVGLASFDLAMDAHVYEFLAKTASQKFETLAATLFAS
ncbi:hypothetical protein PanWU01x14_296130 [Parasponia andersonii]|uniref:Uncharacterized protein n=1 Tax=Parasponia andersonii TaxID=3476 RepID=A0A2P5AVT3_PARAD|nr:hypothetical protein PanWU01x14_296130 [Parasponia andersonii]